MSSALLASPGLLTNDDSFKLFDHHQIAEAAETLTLKPAKGPSQIQVFCFVLHWQFQCLQTLQRECTGWEFSTLAPAPPQQRGQLVVCNSKLYDESVSLATSKFQLPLPRFYCSG